MPGSESDSLTNGIEEEARSEADRIIRDAEKKAEERKKAVYAQVERIIGDAEEKADEQIRRITKNFISAAGVETRRISLRVREQVIRETMDRVSGKTAEKVEKPEYRKILIGWIVEAAIGLGAAEAAVNTSREELPLIDEKLLRRAEKEVHDLTGRKIRLSVSKADPLLGQGIVLTGQDGRTAFNNQVRTRLLRYESEIRKIIYQELSDISEV